MKIKAQLQKKNKKNEYTEIFKNLKRKKKQKHKRKFKNNKRKQNYLFLNQK